MNGKDDLFKPKIDEEEPLEIDLTQEEFNYAVWMTEHSIKRLSKAHIIELKSLMKPHHYVEKVLWMLCILRGSQAPNLRAA